MSHLKLGSISCTTPDSQGWIGKVWRFFCFYDLCVYTNILVSKDFYLFASLVIPMKCYYFFSSSREFRVLILFALHSFSDS